MKNKSKKIRVQTLLFSMIICAFSGVCYKSMIEDTEWAIEVEECKNLMQEAEDFMQTIDIGVKFLDDCWYKSIPNKSVLSKIDAVYSYMLTKEIASKQVIKGKDDWLFYNSIGDGDTIADYEGTNLYSEEQLEQLSIGAEHLQKTLKSKDIEFQLLVCPNKEIVYYEYMPDTYKRAETTRGDVVYEAFVQKGINIVYPKTLLEANKYRQLYYTYDTHWNQLGAYVATRKVLEKWGIDVEVLIEREISSKPLKECHHLSAMEDLANMAGVLPILERKKEDFEYVVKGTANIDWEKAEEIEAERKTAYYHNEEAKIKKTLFLVGDSFRIAMLPLLCDVFEDVYVVSRGYYESGSLEQINPDYVLAEYVERYTDELADIADLILQ